MTIKPTTPLCQRIGFLDGLRGLAALYVMLEYARWLLWEGFRVLPCVSPQLMSFTG